MATRERVDPAETPEILSNEQIEELLREATDRLTNASDSAALAVETTENEDVVAIGAVRKRQRLPKLTHSLDGVAYIEVENGIAQVDQKRLLDDEQRKLSNALRSVEVDQLSQGKQKKVSPQLQHTLQYFCMRKIQPKFNLDADKRFVLDRPAINDKPSLGAEWFDLPKTVMTPQLKRDLQLIEMRSVLDPHRHYKKASGKSKVPAFSQLGTVVEGPAEWYSSRINKKDRAKNFVEEAMAGERESGRFKKKYEEIQGKKISGRKSYYKSLMDRRKKRK